MAVRPAIANKGRILREFPLASGATYVDGAVLLVSSQELNEAGTDPAVIAGFAPENAVYGSGDDFNPGRRLVCIAGAKSTFWIEGSTAPVEATHVGNSYGLTKDAGGQWYLDIAKTAASARAIVLAVDTVRGLFEISILAANRQFDS